MSLKGEKEKLLTTSATRTLVWLISVDYGSVGNSHINHSYLIEFHRKRNVHSHNLTVLQQWTGHADWPVWNWDRLHASSPLRSLSHFLSLCLWWRGPQVVPCPLHCKTQMQLWQSLRTVWGCHPTPTCAYSCYWLNLRRGFFFICALFTTASLHPATSCINSSITENIEPVTAHSGLARENLLKLRVLGNIFQEKPLARVLICVSSLYFCYNFSMLSEILLVAWVILRE